MQLKPQNLEARVGIEPTHKAFAEPCLTTWLPRRVRFGKVNHFRWGARLFDFRGRVFNFPIARWAAHSTDAEHHLAAFDADGVGGKVDAGGRPLGLAGREIEAAVVLRAFDDVVHYEAVGEVHFLMRAKAVGCVIFVVGRAVEGEGASAVVETNDVFFFDVADLTGGHPGFIRLVVHERRSVYNGSAGRA